LSYASLRGNEHPSIPSAKDLPSGHTYPAGGPR